MARERGARDKEGPFPEPDTLPMMNIILMLILALVTMSAMLPLGFISSEAQKLARADVFAPPKETEEKKPLNLIVFITNDGFNISVRGDAKMGPADPQNPGRKLPLVPNLAGRPDPQNPGHMLPVYDYATFKVKLEEFKKLDPQELSMTIAADPEVKFDVVIQTMDASRFDEQKQALFPKVSFAAGIVG